MENEKLTTEIAVCENKARSIEIKDTPTYLEASTFYKAIDETIQKVKESFDPIVEQAHKAHKEAIAQRDKHLKPLEAAKSLIKQKMAEYNLKLRQEEEERNRKIAEEMKKQEEEMKLAQALALEQAGEKELAEAVLEQPSNIVPLIVAKPEIPNVGVSFRKVWKFRIVNPDLIPRAYLKIDEVKIGQVVRAMKDGANIPGVEVFTELV